MVTGARWKAALVVGSILAALFAVECSVRVHDAVQGRGFFSGSRNRLSRPKPLLPFLTFGFPLYREVRGERFVSSCHGELYPLTKPAATTRIVAFGGST